MTRLRSCVAVLTALVVAGGMAGAGDVLAQVAPGPNGLIAYSSWDGDGNYDIYVVDPAVPEAEPVRLTTDGQYNSNPDWSPDGTRITFDGWGQNGGPRIQVMDTDPATDDQVVITDPCTDFGCYGDFQPAWSPDGSRIAFVSSRPNQDGSENWSYEIYVVDAAGEVGPLPDATRLTTDPFDDDNIEDSHVTWSPDGTRIAFVSTGRGTESSSCDLWMMDAQDLDGDGFGDNMTRLTFDESFNCDAFEDFSPKWSPNSSLIAFTSTRSGFFDIWLVNSDDPTDLRNVTQTPTVYEDQPGWSPDGTQVIFRSSESGAYEIYSLPVPPPTTAPASRVASAVSAAPTPTQLTFDGMNKQQPDWGTSGSSTGPFMLTVDRTGAGTVTAKPAGIRCGNDCSEAYPAGTAVTLKARPKAGSVFVRWQGACTGRGACTVAMSEARSVIAVFRAQT